MYKAIKDRDPDDDWATEVQGRVEGINDLRSEDAIYHSSCDAKFRMGHSKTPQAAPLTQESMGDLQIQLICVDQKVERVICLKCHLKINGPFKKRYSCSVNITNKVF